MLTILGMETNPQQAVQPADFLAPFAGWQAAARWNQLTFEWMARSLQQWMVLATTVPPQFLAPPSLRRQAQAVPAESGQAVAARPVPEHAAANAVRTRDAAPRRKRSEARPVARAEGRSSTRPKPPARSRKARSRG